VTVAISAEGGCAVVEIPDADGEVFAYEVRAVGLVGGWQSWSVARRAEEGEEPPADHAHTVGTRDERWRCSCRDFYYRGRLRPCKHIAACHEVIEFYKRFTGGRT
jgi:hypothetical protein